MSQVYCPYWLFVGGAKIIIRLRLQNFLPFFLLFIFRRIQCVARHFYIGLAMPAVRVQFVAGAKHPGYQTEHNDIKQKA